MKGLIYISEIGLIVDKNRRVINDNSYHYGSRIYEDKSRSCIVIRKNMYNQILTKLENSIFILIKQCQKLFCNIVFLTWKCILWK